MFHLVPAVDILTPQPGERWKHMKKTWVNRSLLMKEKSVSVSGLRHVQRWDGTFIRKIPEWELFVLNLPGD